MINTKPLMLAVLLSLALTTWVNAQESKGRVYVWDFVDNKGQQTDLTDRLTSEFEVALNQAKCYQVLERRRFNKVLAHIKNEKAIANLDGISKESQGEIKKITNAQIVVFGQVDDDIASGEYKISVTFQNLDSSKEVKSIRIRRGRIQDSESRENAMKELVKEICGNNASPPAPHKETGRDWPATQKPAEEKARRIAQERNAQFIVYGESVTGSIANGSYNEYVFVGYSNTPVLFTMQSTKGNFWAGVRVNNSNNLSVLKSEFVRRIDKIPFTPQTDDAYILRITGERNFGDYVIELSYISGPPHERNRPRLISMNGNRLGNIAKDSFDEYTFRGHANEAILFTLQPTEGNFWAGVRIFNSRKIQVLKSEFVRPIEKIPFTPQSDDEYTIRITGERNFGSYVIVLSKP